MMACTKAIPMIAYIGIAALLAAANSPSAAQDVKVQSAVAIDGKVSCFNWGGTGATRPCEGFTPPPKVAVGEKFSAGGKTHQIGVILAHQVEKDVAVGIRKGDWICGAAETLEDLPVDKSRNRTWLSIFKCQPDMAGRAPLPSPG